MEFKNTVLFDFDGVIHSYISGWKGDNIIPDKPVEGIKEAIDEIRKKYHVVIFSSRCNTEQGKTAVENYLKKHNIVVDDIVDTKPPAIVMIDDRAITFDGKADTLLEKIENFKTWYEKE